MILTRPQPPERSRRRGPLAWIEDGYARTRTILHSGLLESIVSLYGIQICTYALPLITIPYLARVLGPAGWGLTSLAQAFGLYIAVLVEYGFNYSATRETARYRDDPERLSALVSGVLGAKAVLGLLVVPFALVARLFVPALSHDPRLFWAGVLFGSGMGFSMMWYFQGFERMRLVASIDIVTRALATAGIFLWVHTPQDGWKVPALYGALFWLSELVTLMLIWRELPFRAPSRAAVIDALRTGWSMFLFRTSTVLYAAGNTFVLGFFAPPQMVGFYAGAEKINKSANGLLGPLPQALYPRLSYLLHRTRGEASELFRFSFVAMTAGGALLGLVMLVFAPLLVRLLLGPGYEPAVPALRIMAALPLLVALNSVMGVQWMIPLSMERQLNWIVVLAGLVNLGAAVLLAPALAHVGMAVAVVTAELFITIAIFYVLRKRRLDPISLFAGHMPAALEAEAPLLVGVEEGAL